MDTTVSLKATGKEAKDAVDEGFERLNELDKLAGEMKTAMSAASTPLPARTTSRSTRPSMK